MGTLLIELERAKKNGMEELASFSGAVRSVENNGLEEGDTFKIPAKPEDFKIYVQKFDSGNKVEFMYVEIVSSKSGKKPGDVIPFYPSTFTKRRRRCDENGIDLDGANASIHTTGTAAEIFQNSGSIQEGMEKLCGKTLVVSKITPIFTHDFNDREKTVKTNIPTIDVVEASSK